MEPSSDPQVQHLSSMFPQLPPRVIADAIREAGCPELALDRLLEIASAEDSNETALAPWDQPSAVTHTEVPELVVPLDQQGWQQVPASWLNDMCPVGCDTPHVSAGHPRDSEYRGSSSHNTTSDNASTAQGQTLLVSVSENAPTWQQQQLMHEAHWEQAGVSAAANVPGWLHQGADAVQSEGFVGGAMVEEGQPTWQQQALMQEPRWEQELGGTVGQHSHQQQREWLHESSWQQISGSHQTGDEQLTWQQQQQQRELVDGTSWEQLSTSQAGDSRQLTWQQQQEMLQWTTSTQGSTVQGTGNRQLNWQQQQQQQQQQHEVRQPTTSQRDYERQLTWQQQQQAPQKQKQRNASQEAIWELPDASQATGVGPPTWQQQALMARTGRGERSRSASRRAGQGASGTGPSQPPWDLPAHLHSDSLQRTLDHQSVRLSSTSPTSAGHHQVQNSRATKDLLRESMTLQHTSSSLTRAAPTSQAPAIEQALQHSTALFLHKLQSSTVSLNKGSIPQNNLPARAARTTAGQSSNRPTAGEHSGDSTGGAQTTGLNTQTQGAVPVMGQWPAGGQATSGRVQTQQGDTEQEEDGFVTVQRRRPRAHGTGKQARAREVWLASVKAGNEEDNSPKRRSWWPEWKPHPGGPGLRSRNFMEPTADNTQAQTQLVAPNSSSSGAANDNSRTVGSNNNSVNGAARDSNNNGAGESLFGAQMPEPDATHVPGWVGSQPAHTSPQLPANTGVSQPEAMPLHEPEVVDSAILWSSSSRRSLDGGSRPLNPDTHLPQVVPHLAQVGGLHELLFSNSFTAARSAAAMQLTVADAAPCSTTSNVTTGVPAVQPVSTSDQPQLASWPAATACSQPPADDGLDHSALPWQDHAQAGVTQPHALQVGVTQPHASQVGAAPAVAAHQIGGPLQFLLQYGAPSTPPVPPTVTPPTSSSAIPTPPPALALATTQTLDTSQPTNTGMLVGPLQFLLSKASRAGVPGDPATAPASRTPLTTPNTKGGDAVPPPNPGSQLLASLKRNSSQQSLISPDTNCNSPTPQGTGLTGKHTAHGLPSQHPTIVTGLQQPVSSFPLPFLRLLQASDHDAHSNTSTPHSFHSACDSGLVGSNANSPAQEEVTTNLRTPSTASPSAASPASGLPPRQPPTHRALFQNDPIDAVNCFTHNAAGASAVPVQPFRNDNAAAGRGFQSTSRLGSRVTSAVDVVPVETISAHIAAAACLDTQQNAARPDGMLSSEPPTPSALPPPSTLLHPVPFLPVPQTSTPPANAVPPSAVTAADSAHVVPVPHPSSSLRTLDRAADPTVADQVPHRHVEVDEFFMDPAVVYVKARHDAGQPAVPTHLPPGKAPTALINKLRLGLLNPSSPVADAGATASPVSALSPPVSNPSPSPPAAHAAERPFPVSDPPISGQLSSVTPLRESSTPVSASSAPLVERLKLAALKTAPGLTSPDDTRQPTTPECMPSQSPVCSNALTAAGEACALPRTTLGLVASHALELNEGLSSACTSTRSVTESHSQLSSARSAAAHAGRSGPTSVLAAAAEVAVNELHAMTKMNDVATHQQSVASARSVLSQQAVTASPKMSRDSEASLLKYPEQQQSPHGVRDHSQVLDHTHPCHSTSSQLCLSPLRVRERAECLTETGALAGMKVDCLAAPQRMGEGHAIEVTGVREAFPSSSSSSLERVGEDDAAKAANVIDVPSVQGVGEGDAAVLSTLQTAPSPEGLRTGVALTLANEREAPSAQGAPRGAPPESTNERGAQSPQASKYGVPPECTNEREAQGDALACLHPVEARLKRNNTNSCKAVGSSEATHKDATTVQSADNAAAASQKLQQVTLLTPGMAAALLESAGSANIAPHSSTSNADSAPAELMCDSSARLAGTTATTAPTAEGSAAGDSGSKAADSDVASLEPLTEQGVSCAAAAQVQATSTSDDHMLPGSGDAVRGVDQSQGEQLLSSSHEELHLGMMHREVAQPDNLSVNEQGSVRERQVLHSSGTGPHNILVALPENLTAAGHGLMQSEATIESAQTGSPDVRKNDDVTRPVHFDADAGLPMPETAHIVAPPHTKARDCGGPGLVRFNATVLPSHLHSSDFTSKGSNSSEVAKLLQGESEVGPHTSAFVCTSSAPVVGGRPALMLDVLSHSSFEASQASGMPGGLPAVSDMQLLTHSSSRSVGDSASSLSHVSSRRQSTHTPHAELQHLDSTLSSQYDEEVAPPPRVASSLLEELTAMAATKSPFNSPRRSTQMSNIISPVPSPHSPQRTHISAMDLLNHRLHSVTQGSQGVPNAALMGQPGHPPALVPSNSPRLSYMPISEKAASDLRAAAPQVGQFGPSHIRHSSSYSSLSAAASVQSSSILSLHTSQLGLGGAPAFAPSDGMTLAGMDPAGLGGKIDPYAPGLIARRSSRTDLTLHHMPVAGDLSSGFTAPSMAPGDPPDMDLALPVTNLGDLHTGQPNVNVGSMGTGVSGIGTLDIGLAGAYVGTLEMGLAGGYVGTLEMGLAGGYAGAMDMGSAGGYVGTLDTGLPAEHVATLELGSSGRHAAEFDMGSAGGYVSTREAGLPSGQMAPLELGSSSAYLGPLDVGLAGGPIGNVDAGVSGGHAATLELGSSGRHVGPLALVRVNNGQFGMNVGTLDTGLPAANLVALDMALSGSNLGNMDMALSGTNIGNMDMALSGSNIGNMDMGLSGANMGTMDMGLSGANMGTTDMVLSGANMGAMDLGLSGVTMGTVDMGLSCINIGSRDAGVSGADVGTLDINWPAGGASRLATDLLNDTAFGHTVGAHELVAAQLFSMYPTSGGFASSQCGSTVAGPDTTGLSPGGIAPAQNVCLSASNTGISQPIVAATLGSTLYRTRSGVSSQDPVVPDLVVRVPSRDSNATGIAHLAVASKAARATSAASQPADSCAHAALPSLRIRIPTEDHDPGTLDSGGGGVSSKDPVVTVTSSVSAGSHLSTQTLTPLSAGVAGRDWSGKVLTAATPGPQLPAVVSSPMRMGMSSKDTAVASRAADSAWSAHKAIADIQSAAGLHEDPVLSIMLSSAAPTHSPVDASRLNSTPALLHDNDAEDRRRPALADKVALTHKAATTACSMGMASPRGVRPCSADAPAVHRKNAVVGPGGTTPVFSVGEFQKGADMFSTLPNMGNESGLTSSASQNELRTARDGLLSVFASDMEPASDQQLSRVAAAPVGMLGDVLMVYPSPADDAVTQGSGTAQRTHGDKAVENTASAMADMAQLTYGVESVENAANIEAKGGAEREVAFKSGPAEAGAVASKQRPEDDWAAALQDSARKERETDEPTTIQDSPSLQFLSALPWLPVVGGMAGGVAQDQATGSAAEEVVANEHDGVHSNLPAGHLTSGELEGGMAGVTAQVEERGRERLHSTATAQVGQAPVVQELSAVCGANEVGGVDAQQDNFEEEDGRKGASPQDGATGFDMQEQGCVRPSPWIEKMDADEGHQGKPSIQDPDGTTRAGDRNGAGVTADVEVGRIESGDQQKGVVLDTSGAGSGDGEEGVGVCGTPNRFAANHTASSCSDSEDIFFSPPHLSGSVGAAAVAGGEGGDSVTKREAWVGTAAAAAHGCTGNAMDDAHMGDLRRHVAVSRPLFLDESGARTEGSAERGDHNAVISQQVYTSRHLPGSGGAAGVAAAPPSPGPVSWLSAVGGWFRSDGVRGGKTGAGTAGHADSDPWSADGAGGARDGVLPAVLHDGRHDLVASGLLSDNSVDSGSSVVLLGAPSAFGSVSSADYRVVDKKGGRVAGSSSRLAPSAASSAGVNGSDDGSCTSGVVVPAGSTFSIVGSSTGVHVDMAEDMVLIDTLVEAGADVVMDAPNGSPRCLAANTSGHWELDGGQKAVESTCAAGGVKGVPTSEVANVAGFMDVQHASTAIGQGSGYELYEDTALTSNRRAGKRALDSASALMPEDNVAFTHALGTAENLGLGEKASGFGGLGERQVGHAQESMHMLDDDGATLEDKVLFLQSVFPEYGLDSGALMSLLKDMGGDLEKALQLVLDMVTSAEESSTAEDVLFPAAQYPGLQNGEEVINPLAFAQNTTPPWVSDGIHPVPEEVFAAMTAESPTAVLQPSSLHDACAHEREVSDHDEHDRALAVLCETFPGYDPAVLGMMYQEYGRQLDPTLCAMHQLEHDLEEDARRKRQQEEDACIAAELAIKEGSVHLSAEGQPGQHAPGADMTNGADESAAITGKGYRSSARTSRSSTAANSANTTPGRTIHSRPPSTASLDKSPEARAKRAWGQAAGIGPELVHKRQGISWKSSEVFPSLPGQDLGGSSVTSLTNSWDPEDPWAPPTYSALAALPPPQPAPGRDADELHPDFLAALALQDAETPPRSTTLPTDAHWAAVVGPPEPSFLSQAESSYSASGSTVPGQTDSGGLASTSSALRDMAVFEGSMVKGVGASGSEWQVVLDQGMLKRHANVLMSKVQGRVPRDVVLGLLTACEGRLDLAEKMLEEMGLELRTPVKRKRTDTLSKSGSLPSLRSREEAAKARQDLYQSARAEAFELEKRKEELRRRAMELFNSGQRVQAHIVSQQAQALRREIRERHSQAADSIFANNNAGLQNEYTLDLHALHVDEAINKVEYNLSILSKLPTKMRFKIITGRGVHSEYGPKLYGAVRQYLQKHGYKYEENIGFLEVMLQPSRTT